MLKTVRFYTQKFTTTVYIILICKKKVRLTFSLILLTIRVLSSTKHCISTFNCSKNLEAYQYKVSCHKPLISGECYLTKKRFTSNFLIFLFRNKRFMLDEIINEKIMHHFSISFEKKYVL